MNKMLFMVLAIGASTASAEVFKCKSVFGAVEYQPSPCASSTVQQQVVDIKPTSLEEQEQARLKLQAWQKENKAYDAARNRAEQQRQAEIDKQTFLNTQQRIATAEEQQALAAQRLAGEREHRNRLNQHNSLYNEQHYTTSISNQSQNDVGDDNDHRRRHGHEGRHPRRHEQGIQHPHELGDYGLHRPAGSLGAGLGEYAPVKPQTEPSGGLDTN
jgi:hypothetical protein